MRTKIILGLIVVLAAVLSSGCASAVRISQFDTFATAGTAYAKAMDGLLTEAEDMLVDTNSKKLLLTQKATIELAKKATDEEQKKSIKKMLLEETGGLGDMDNVMRENLEASEIVRAQVRLLSVYFSQLAGLATTDAAELFGAQLAGSVDSLNTLSVGLRNSTAISNPGAKQALGTVGSAIVTAVQARSLEQELKLRGPTIENVLIVHEGLLDHLKDQILADLTLLRNREYESKVEEPLGDGSVAGQQQEWIDNRRRLLTPAPLNKQVNATISALQKLRTAWTQLQAKSLSVADVQAVLDDLQPVIAAAEGLKR